MLTATRRWMQRRASKLSNKPHKMQELIDSEAGHRPKHDEPRDYYNRLSDIPNTNKPEWGEL